MLEVHVTGAVQLPWENNVLMSFFYYRIHNMHIFAAGNLVCLPKVTFRSFFFYIKFNSK